MLSKTSSMASKTSSSSSSSRHGLEMTLEEQYKLVSSVELEKAGKLPILDKDGRSRSFKSLWDRNEPTERRNIIVFIRHFFCGVGLLQVLTLAVVYQWT